MKDKLFLLLIALAPIFSQAAQKDAQGRSSGYTDTLGKKIKYFRNPVINGDHADPFVAQKDGNYYFLTTKGNRITIAKTNAMSQLSAAIEKTIWTPPDNSDYSADLWAPELHFIDGKWYVYFAAARKGVNDSNRMFVLENDNQDPTEGTWNFKGKIADPANDQWAIDGSVLSINGKNYLVWSGWENDTEKYKQNIYIAAMSNPWTLSTARVKISTPTNDWERWEPTFLGAGVDEGPIILQRDSNSPLFLVFSASRYSSDNYCLGQIELKANSDPAVAENWINKKQVFVKSDQNAVYGPGHNGFFTSTGKNKKGITQTEFWFIYHARNEANQPNQPRTSRMQQINWNTDGSPNFGIPLSIGKDIPCPIAER